MEGIGEKNRVSPLEKNDKDAVAVYEVVRGLPQDEDWDAACWQVEGRSLLTVEGCGEEVIEAEKSKIYCEL